MNIFLRLLLFSNILSGYDLIDFYRENGVQKIEIEAERLLQSKDYWRERLKNLDTAFGYYENLKEIVIVNKNEKILNLYRMVEDEFNLVFRENIIIGKKIGWKKREGDRKTPTGVYRLNEKLKNLNQFYGPIAFVISYPNLYDSSLERTGSGIWIHGMPINGKREDFTKGCIALSNNLLETFNKKIRDYKNSLLIIGEERLPRVSKEDLSIILSSLYNWLSSWKNGEFDNYISFYSMDFKLDNNRDFFWLLNHKKRVFNKKENLEFRIKNINISPYPNGEERNIFRVSFEQSYILDSSISNRKKELYIEVSRENIQILLEK